MAGKERYILGYQAEWLVLNHFRKAGWLCFRLLQSGRYGTTSYPDIVCLDPIPAVIEVKSTSSEPRVQVSKEDVEKLARLVREPNILGAFAFVYKMDGLICLCPLDWVFERLKGLRRAKVHRDEARLYCSCWRY